MVLSILPELYFIDAFTLSVMLLLYLYATSGAAFKPVNPKLSLIPSDQFLISLNVLLEPSEIPLLNPSTVNPANSLNTLDGECMPIKFVNQEPIFDTQLEITPCVVF